MKTALWTTMALGGLLATGGALYGLTNEAVSSAYIPEEVHAEISSDEVAPNERGPHGSVTIDVVGVFGPPEEAAAPLDAGDSHDAANDAAQEKREALHEFEADAPQAPDAPPAPAPQASVEEATYDARDEAPVAPELAHEESEPAAPADEPEEPATNEGDEGGDDPITPAIPDEPATLDVEVLPQSGGQWVEPQSAGPVESQVLATPDLDVPDACQVEYCYENRTINGTRVETPPVESQEIEVSGFHESVSVGGFRVDVEYDGISHQTPRVPSTGVSTSDLRLAGLCWYVRCLGPLHYEGQSFASTPYVGQQWTPRTGAGFNTSREHVGLHLWTNQWTSMGPYSQYLGVPGVGGTTATLCASGCALPAGPQVQREGGGFGATAGTQNNLVQQGFGL